ncbi:hypothetical protein ACFX2I_030272 [Malus domestica]
MENEAGGIANVGCIDKDLRNVEGDMQKEIKGHDADMPLFLARFRNKKSDEVIESTAYLKCDAIREDEKECVYIVIRADVESSTLRNIVHDKVSSFAKCSCRKFEFEGIPCRYILFFLRSIHIVDLPSQYIMKRWTQSVKAERVWDGDGLEIKDGLRSNLGVGEVPTKRKLQKHMINEPAPVKAKGTGKRMKSSKEKAMGKAKKYKACG